MSRVRVLQGAFLINLVCNSTSLLVGFRYTMTFATSAYLPIDFNFSALDCEFFLGLPGYP